MSKKAWARGLVILFVVLMCLTLLIPFTRSFADNGDGTSGGNGQSLRFVGSSPGNGATNVDVGVGDIKLTFSKNVINMAVAETNKTHFTLTDASGVAVPVDVVMADDQIEPDKKRDVIIRPKQPLQYGTQYRLLIAKGVQYKNGDTTQQDIVITFTTASKGLPGWLYGVIGA